MEASNIKKLFKTSECFIIPSYQRAYSWGRVQREQFIQDLRDASDAYYLGHFLFEKEEGKDVTTYNSRHFLQLFEKRI